jgi:hypothetical protein
VSKVAEHYLQDLWKTAETTGERAFSTRRAAAVKQEKQTTRTKGHTKTASLVSLLSSCGRDDRTRTGDPYVPNVVRYQLRYIPPLALKERSLFLKRGAKIRYFSETRQFYGEKFVYIG